MTRQTQRNAPSRGMGFLRRSKDTRPKGTRRRPSPQPRGGKAGSDGQRRQRAAGFAYGIVAAALAWAGSDLLFSADTHRRLHLPAGTLGDVLAFAMMAGWLTLLIAVVRRGLVAPRRPQPAARSRSGKSGTAIAKRRRTAAAQPGSPAAETDGTVDDPTRA